MVQDEEETRIDSPHYLEQVPPEIADLMRDAIGSGCYLAAIRIYVKYFSGSKAGTGYHTIMGYLKGWAVDWAKDRDDDFDSVEFFEDLRNTFLDIEYAKRVSGE
jgi:hypothetical protein